PSTPFLFNHPAPTQIYTLSLHDALPILLKFRLPFDDPPGSTTSRSDTNNGAVPVTLQMLNGSGTPTDYHGATNSGVAGAFLGGRSEEHTSELQSRGHLVCRLLLEKKKEK